MLKRALLLSVLLLALTPRPGAAVTVDDLVALSRQGLADSILVAVIDADRTVFTLTPDQIVDLKRQGLSDPVIVKMLGTAREYGGDVTALPPVPMPAPAPAVDEAPAEPPVVVAVPFVVAVPVPAAHAPHRAPAPQATAPPATSLNPLGRRFINDGWVDGVGFGRFINH